MLVADAEEESHMIATTPTTEPETLPETSATGTLAPNRTAEISTPMISLPTLCVAHARAKLPRTSKDVVTGSTMAKLTQEVTDAIGTGPGQDSAATGTMMTSSPLETAVLAVAAIVERIIRNHAYPPAV